MTDQLIPPNPVNPPPTPAQPPMTESPVERPSYLSYTDDHDSRSMRMIIIPIGMVVGIVCLVFIGLWVMSSRQEPEKATVAEVVDGPAPSPSVIDFPTENSLIKNPLRITHTVPAGWAFEGSCPIKLMDEHGNILAQGSAHEVIPGSWQSGKPARVIGELQFSTTAEKGYFVISKDNPSGLPENDASYKFSVRFMK